MPLMFPGTPAAVDCLKLFLGPWLRAAHLRGLCSACSVSIRRRFARAECVEPAFRETQK